MSTNPGQDPVGQSDMTAVAEHALRNRGDWTPEQRLGAARVAASLVSDIPNSETWTVGLAGAPGCGKSALAGLVVALLEVRGIAAQVLSLDDYYLAGQDRESLSRIHPLFEQRGVPGTHDWAALIGHLDQIRNGSIEGLRLPRFEKARDEPVPVADFSPVERVPQVLLLEGWTIGAPPQTDAELTRPVNAMEAASDPEAQWRSMVNAHLDRYHRDLLPRLDRRWFLAAPDWESVIEWRWRQELDLRATGSPGQFKSRREVIEFLDRFQRIVEHMLASCGQWADTVVRIDRQHVMAIS